MNRPKVRSAEIKCEVRAPVLGGGGALIYKHHHRTPARPVEVQTISAPTDESLNER